MDDQTQVNRRGLLTAAGCAGIGLLAAQTASAQAQQRARRGEDAESHATAKKQFEEEAARQWRYSGAFSDAAAAASYLNVAPAQGPGEAIVTLREDGRVDVLIYL